MDSIAAEYNVHKSTIGLVVRWVENTLAVSGDFALSGKKALKRKSVSIEYVVVNVMGSPICATKKYCEKTWKTGEHKVALSR